MQNAPVKLLFILDDFSGPNAGTEVQFWRLIKGLDRSRVAPAIVLLRPSEFLARELGDIPLKVLNITRLRSGRAVAQIVSAALWARRSRFRVAHIFFNDSAIVFPPLLKMLGLRVIVSRRDLGFWYTPRNLPLLRMAARFVDKVVANCHAVRRAVIDAEGFPPGRVDVIYNAADALHSQPGRVDRASCGIPDGVPLVVLVANLRPLKRVGDAVKALALVSAPCSIAPHLLIVGEDRPDADGTSHRTQLERTAVQLGLLDRVHFAGKIADPAPLIRLADVCLLCSETEGLSNVVIEYMLSGKPVVCTNVGGNAELIVDGVCGRVVAAGDVVALASAISELLNGTDLARDWGEAARKRAIELFTPASRMVDSYQHLYEHLAGAVK